MRRTTWLIFGCIGVGTAGLIVGEAWSGWWFGALLWLACGGLWAYGQWRAWANLAPLGFVIYTLGAVLGLWLRQPPLLLLLVVTAALSAWDLDHFARHISNAGRVEQAEKIELQHLRRLLVIDGIALLLAGGALLVRAHFRFSVIFWLGLLAFLGLSQVLKFLKAESD
jgi:hypothetical protein